MSEGELGNGQPDAALSICGQALGAQWVGGGDFYRVGG